MFSAKTKRTSRQGGVWASADEAFYAADGGPVSNIFSFVCLAIKNVFCKNEKNLETGWSLGVGG